MDRFQTEDGTWLAYRDEGEGLPMLSLAGFTRDGRDFDYLAPHLPSDIRHLRLDSRGRGQSEWTGAQTYTVAQEAADVLALLDHLALDRVAIIGSSRGGLLGMLIAATDKSRLLGLCLNDVGPELERDGLEKIAPYIGVVPPVATLQQLAGFMPAALPGFQGVPESRWMAECERHFVQLEGGLGLGYDPALRQAFDDALSAPAADAWPLFDACEGLPLALIHGQNSEILSQAAVQKMRERRPDLHHVSVAGRAHIPFLDEPESLACILGWLDQIRQTSP